MLIDYLPRYMQLYREMREICSSEDIDISKININIDNIKRELFIEKAQDWGIERIEKILGIQASEQESLSYRKFRIKSIMLGTHKSLVEKLKELIPNNDYNLSYNVNTMTLTLRLPVANEMYLNSVIEMLENTIPLNIKLDCSVAYTPHSQVGEYTHSELNDYTHKYIKEELYEQ